MSDNVAPTEVAAREARIILQSILQRKLVQGDLPSIESIAAAVDTAIQAERERCAGIAHSFIHKSSVALEYQTAQEIESAIREGKS